LSTHLPNATVARVGFLLILTFAFAHAGTVLAATLDPSFEPVLRDFGSSSEGFSSAKISVVQPDGKILVAGRFTVANGVARSGTVNSGDAIQTRTLAGQTVDMTNFRSDVNADGFFNAGDTFIVRAASGGSTGP